MIKEKSLIIWDWNGTLLDDTAVCIASMNRMLSSRGMPLLSEPRYRTLFRFPVKDYYVDLGFDFLRESFEDLSVEFISNYRELQSAALLYNGAVELLGAFRERGLQQIILSAMEHESLYRDVKEKGIADFFHAILGAGDHYAHGKAAIASDFILKSGIPAANILLIGDTEHDFEVSSALGCSCILVSHGHHDEMRLKATGAPVQKNFAEVFNFLLNT
jgi:phosphoglycolate phosphatase